MNEATQRELLRILIAIVRKVGLVELDRSAKLDPDPGDGIIVEDEGDRTLVRLVSGKSKVFYFGKPQKAPQPELPFEEAESPSDPNEKPWVLSDEALAAVEDELKGRNR